MYATQMIHLSESTNEAQLRLQQEHMQKQQVWAWWPSLWSTALRSAYSSTCMLGSECLQLTISLTSPEPLYLWTHILALSISSFVLTHVHRQHKHENSRVWKVALCTTMVRFTQHQTYLYFKNVIVASKQPQQHLWSSSWVPRKSVTELSLYFTDAKKVHSEGTGSSAL